MLAMGVSGGPGQNGSAHAHSLHIQYTPFYGFRRCNYPAFRGRSKRIFLARLDLNIFPKFSSVATNCATRARVGAIRPIFFRGVSRVF